MPIYFTAFLVGHIMLTMVIGVIETLVHPMKIKRHPHVLCVLTACGHYPRLDHPLIYMAQNNPLRPSNAI